MIRLPETNCPTGKKEIRFPLDWTYRAVVEANLSAAAVAGLNGALQSFGYRETFAPNGSSSGGKYQSFKVTVTVPDLEKLNALGDALGKVPGVKFLL